MNDPRLAILFDTVDAIAAGDLLRAKTQSGPARLSRRALIPEAYRGNLALHKHLGLVLEFFGLLASGGRRRPIDQELIARRKRLLALLFWRMSSAYYPEARGVYMTKAALQGLSTDYEFTELTEPAVYTALLACFRVLDFTEGQRGRAGGLRLIPPARLRPARRQPGDQTDVSAGATGKLRSIAPVWNIETENDLYSSNRTLLVQFVRQRLLDPDHGDFTRWAIMCDSPGAAPIQKTQRVPDRGQWQNPDVLAVRQNKHSRAFETCAFEVKLQFVKEALGAARSYQNFANFTYVVVAEDTRRILSKRRFVTVLTQAGIGIIGLRQHRNLRTWTEIVPAEYRPCRHVVQSEIVGDYVRAQRRRAKREQNRMSAQ